MAFCTSCGNVISPGARFCGNCGHEQIPDSLKCANCGTELEEGAKFCASCGTSVDAKKEPAAKKVENKTVKKATASGKKIIDAGPKTKPIRKSTKASSVKSGNTKKKSGIGCFFRTLFILFSVVAVAALLIVVVNVLFIDNEENTITSSQQVEDKNDTGLTDTNIPGIVDIEPGDVSHLPENRTQQAEQIRMEPIVEAADIKKAAKTVEEAFVNADIAQIKLLLTESGLSSYSGILEEIQPHLAEYGKAFKNRKLITSTDIYQVYEFYDEKGGKFTAAFELQPDGNWKLTRF